MRAIITFITDFGPGSSYVAQLKGVTLSICSEATLVDISHAIEPQNIRQAAIILADATPRFPAGTIHVAVVDPGVGTTRRLIYAEIGEQRFVAPDNGLLSRLAIRTAPQRIVVLENPDYWLPQRSNTFHGRDILAPVGAHLAAGIDFQDLGPPQTGIVMLDWPESRRTQDGIAGEVILIDSFGNLISNIERSDVESLGRSNSLLVDCGGYLTRGVVPTYAAAMNGEIVALFDSQGRLEVAKVGGSAAEQLQMRVGDSIVVRLP
jgi:S-adenosylmethionine hydrolase